MHTKKGEENIPTQFSKQLQVPPVFFWDLHPFWGRKNNKFTIQLLVLPTKSLEKVTSAAPGEEVNQPICQWVSLTSELLYKMGPHWLYVAVKKKTLI